MTTKQNGLGFSCLQHTAKLQKSEDRLCQRPGSRSLEVFFFCDFVCSFRSFAFLLTFDSGPYKKNLL